MSLRGQTWYSCQSAGELRLRQQVEDLSDRIRELSEQMCGYRDMWMKQCDRIDKAKDAILALRLVDPRDRATLKQHVEHALAALEGK